MRIPQGGGGRFIVRFDMKKLIALVLTLVLLLTGLPLIHAQESHADLNVTFKPAENQDGNVVLEIDITVNNGEAGQSIGQLEFRYENELIASVDSVSARSNAFARSNPLGMSLTAMTSDLEVEVSYIDFNGNPVSMILIVPYEAAEPKLTFKRTASATAVNAGQSVTLTYIVKNEGGVLLNDLEIYDEIVGVVGTIDALYPGDMREFNVDFKLEKDVKSQPQVSYRASYTEQSTVMLLDAMSLVISNPKLTVTLKSDVNAVQAGDSVTLVCSVVNEGNVAFPTVTISDETLGSIIDSAQIEVGKAYSWNKLIKPVNSQNYMFTVNAVDANGNSYTATSNIVSVEVASASEAEDADTLEVTVTPNTKEMEQPGEITFNVLLRNNGVQDVTGLTISDQNGNVIERINSLPAGDKMIPIAVNMMESGEYYFVVDATLPSGTKVQRITAPMSIAVGVVQKSEATLAPTESPEATATVTVSSGGSRGIAPWVIMLLIVIVLLIVACVVVLVILQVRAGRRNDEEDDRYIPAQNYERPRAVPPAQTTDPYDYREEISRVATEYSRPLPPQEQPAPRPERRFAQNDLYRDEDEDVQTVYKAPRTPGEPRTKRND